MLNKQSVGTKNYYTNIFILFWLFIEHNSRNRNRIRGSNLMRICPDLLATPMPIWIQSDANLPRPNWDQRSVPGLIHRLRQYCIVSQITVDFITCLFKSINMIFVIDTEYIYLKMISFIKLFISLSLYEYKYS